MRTCLAALLLTMLTGCVTAPSDSALCRATEASRTAHAGALVLSGDPASMATGRTLIAQIDAACR